PRLDYDLHDRVLALQNALLDGLTAPSLLSRMREAEDRSPSAYTLAEHFDRLTRVLWSEVGRGSETLRGLERPTTRRDLQRAHLDKLAHLLLDPPSGTPDDARALARLQLMRIDARAAQSLTVGIIGDYTRAHLLESRARIQRALTASRELGGTADGIRSGAAATR
ncbi:MAG: zinc-dependent metalloprotease, partial [Gaiellales bacterium]